MNPRGLVPLAVLVASCGGIDRSIVGPRHVPGSSGAPNVARVIDLGDMSSLPAKGNVSLRSSDGVYTVGELILVEGEDFGKLPTISVDGRPAKSIARTGSGGIITRIPSGVSAGEVDVSVSHPGGEDAKKISVTRYIAAASDRGLHVAKAGADGVLALHSTLAMPGASDVCFSHDGRVAFAAVPKEKELRAVSIGAKSGPAIARSYRTGPGRFVELACGARAPVVIAVHERKLFVYDSREPSALSEKAAIKLPEAISAAVVSPDGTAVAALARESNTLLLISLESSTVVATLSLLEGETVSLLRDLVYSPAGDELWVVSGNSEESLVAGSRPTTVHRVAVHGISLSRVGSASVGATSHPKALAVSQREAVMAAAAVRSTAQKATLLLTSREGSGTPLLRTGLDGKSTPLPSEDIRVSEALVSHDQAWAYLVGSTSNGVVLQAAPLRAGEPTSLTLPESATPYAISIAP